MYNPNLILVKNNGRIIDIRAVKHDYTKKDYYIEILNPDNQIVYKGELSSNKLIEVDVNTPITINYYEKKSRKLFDKEDLNLPVLYSIYNYEDDIPQDIVEKVSYEMDNPKGSISEIEYHTIMIKKSTYEKSAREYVESKIKHILLKECNVSLEDAEKLSKQLYAKLYGMGVLQELDDNLEVSEIMVNAYTYPKFKCDIYFTVANKGKMKFYKTFNNLDDMLNVFARAISFSNEELNNLEKATIETTRANGDRVTVIIPKASENYILNIRRFRNFIPSRENMMEVGTINEDIDRLMKALVKGKANIGIGGEMGTGKTTFINYLLTYTDPIERKAVIANVKEINSYNLLDGHDIIHLNVDDEKDFTFKKQMRAALRTTADRIIIPESRGEEFKQVYEANLKTKGNIFTAHATDDSIFLDICADMYVENSPSDVTFIKDKIAKSIDVIIIMKKINNKIRIKSISEVLLDENGKYKGLNRLFYWDFKQGKYVRTKNKITNSLKERLFEEGVPESMIDEI